MNKKNEKKIDYNNLNEILSIGKNILKILLITMIIVAIYVILIIIKEMKVINILITVLSVLSPLFIGFVIAWLLNPLVNYLEKKGVKRVISITLSYITLILIISLIISALIPLVYDQLIDFSNSLPGITQKIYHHTNSIFDKLANIEFINANAAKDKVYDTIIHYGENISQKLPNTIVNGTLSVISGIGTFLIGLIIGFFLLLGFNNINDTIILFVPTKYKKSVRNLLTRINKVLRAYVNGALFDAAIIFIACSIAFALLGLKAPILFALFCALMNVIPYAGPYIGAVPALIVGFSQSMGVGIGVGISIIVIQTLEGNILSPIVMSKTTKLHPVSIIVGLLVFGHFFGIIGMLLSTPIIGVAKAIFDFVNNKYHIFGKGEKNETD